MSSGRKGSGGDSCFQMMIMNVIINAGYSEECHQFTVS